MSAKGKGKRNEILQKAGNVDEALAYLQNLDESVLRPITGLMNCSDILKSIVSIWLYPKSR